MTLESRMQAAIEAALPPGDFVPAVVAAELAAHLRSTDPDLLANWLWLRAETVLAEEIRRQVRSQRASARVREASAAFASAAAEHAAGESGALSRWLDVRYVIDSKNTQRRLADMNAEDLLFVAGNYDRTARRALLESAFHRALAARVGPRSVGEVFTEQEIESMYRSLQAPSMP